MNLSPFFEKELEESQWGRGEHCSASQDPGGEDAPSGRRLCDSPRPVTHRSLPPAASHRQTGGQDHAVSLVRVTKMTQGNAAATGPSR